MTILRLLVLVAMMAMLSACGGSSSTTQPDDDLFGDYGDGAPDQGADSSGMGDDGFAEGSEFSDADGRIIGGPSGDRDDRLVYFDYDKADVPNKYLPLLEAHGSYLASRPDSRLRLEGHADERGSREYNIGLGERRAQAVRQILLLQGASAAQLSTVSYGEERPAVLGSDEEALSLNRRVELVYGQ